MRLSPVFFRFILISYLILFVGASNVNSQSSKNLIERPSHSGSNKRVNHYILFSQDVQKQRSDSQFLKQNELIQPNINRDGSIGSTTLSVNGVINVTVKIIGATCGYNNGTVIALASGGTAPYTYDIGDGWKYQTGNFPHVLPGSYKLIVTDATGLSTSVDVTVDNTYPKVTLTASSYQKASGCAVADASVTLQASGGTPPYQYSMDGVNYQNSNIFSNFYPGVYDFYVRDANGCTGSFNSFWLSNLENFSCNATGMSYPTSVCSNEGELDVTGFGPNQPYTYSIDGTNYQSSGRFSNINSGLYILRLKDATGAIQIIAVSVHQSCYINIDYISVDAACGVNDGTLTITATNGTAPYTYTIDGLNFQSSNVFTGLSPGSYYLTVKDANGFTNSLAATVYDRCPIVSATTYNETCAKNDGAIHAIAWKGTSPYYYSIDGVNFQTSTEFTGLAAGNYTLTLRDANGFVSKTTAIVNNACIQVIAQAVNAKCGINGSITASSINGTAPYQYSIDGNKFQSSNVFTGLTPGDYTLTVKDGSGKIGSTIVNITDVPGALVSATASNATCADNDGTISIKGNGGTLPFSYSIDGTNFQASNVFNRLRSGSYVAYIKDGNGCTTSNPIIITIDCPVVSVIATDETCGGKNATITASGNGGTPPFQYSIDGTNFSNSQSFSSLSSGNYIITIKDALAITNTASVVVKNVCPVVTATVTDGKCTSTGGIITAQATDGYLPYEYSIDGIDFQQSNVFNNLSTGNYTVSVKDSHGLMNTIVATVNNFPSPHLNVNFTSVSCLNNDGQITLMNSGGTSPFTYSIDAVNFQSRNIFSALAKGDYNATIKDANGCADTQKITIGLNDNLSLSAGGQIELCEGTPAQLNVSSNALSFNWSPQKNISSVTSPNPTVSPSQTTMYFVTAALGICSKTDSVLVNINAAPVAIAKKDTTICYGQSVALIGSGGSTYSWSPQTYLDNASSATPVSINPKSSVIYSLIVKDDKGCSSLNNATVNITVTPPAKLFAGNDTAIVINQPFQLNAQDINNSRFVNYSWSPADGLNNRIIENPVTTLDHDIVYKVVATTQAGCEGSDEIAIKVYKGPDIFVPTAFTPNHDGLNDILKPIPVGIKQFKYFAVFNRYGERIFYSTNPSKGWDGNVKNMQQKTDVFVWISEGLDDKGNDVRRQGTVVIIL